MRDLEALIEAAGHSDFRDARGPLGLTQRQANGKFTRDEAEALIGLLEAQAEGHDGPFAPPPDDEGASATPSAPPEPRRISHEERQNAEAGLRLRDVPDEVLAAELQRRGWAVIGP
ncbi:hypothetical protein [Candidatus Neomicrothrix sp.]|jgi:hypothetical protein|uniref:Uncharacterized protein n=1 Tax=Candidatus Neomicrothrix subdominans TaxID=2954438 RepID=A0A936TG42_9ACTN|nr:hypothetical protein [Candidatus Microthrix sp.]MBK6969398.1 hypothetical protein [Candidatus Microthrix sp.]MBK9298722.1 hypothetical protein [Candidatus Microthrix subdominans]HMS49560.1 hypothetical protein [Candidatus Microthrix sp.]